MHRHDNIPPTDEVPEIRAADGGDYLTRRRDIMKKLAAGAVAVPTVLTAVTARPAAASVVSPPPPG